MNAEIVAALEEKFPPADPRIAELFDKLERLVESTGPEGNYLMERHRKDLTGVIRSLLDEIILLDSKR